MSFLRIALFILLLPLAACVNNSKAPPATLAPVYTVPPQTAFATIKSSGDASGSMFNITQVAFLAAIDGKDTPSTGYFDPVKIEPGKHALLVGYRFIGGEGVGFAPVMIDAKPGVSYVVKYENAGVGNALVDALIKVSNIHLYLEDEKTGQPATAKINTELLKNTNIYTQSTAQDAATLRGHLNESFLGDDACYISAIDGDFIPIATPNPLMKDHTDYKYVAKITPGNHAITVGVQLGNISGIQTVMLNAEPRSSYAVKCTTSVKRFGSRAMQALAISIENDVTHAVAAPPTDVPIYTRITVY